MAIKHREKEKRILVEIAFKWALRCHALKVNLLLMVEAPKSMEGGKTNWGHGRIPGPGVQSQRETQVTALPHDKTSVALEVIDLAESQEVIQSRFSRKGRELEPMWEGCPNPAGSGQDSAPDPPVPTQLATSPWLLAQNLGDAISPPAFKYCRFVEI